MPEIPILPPIASAPISVVLLLDHPQPQPEMVIAGWVTFLNGLDREYEILLADAGASPLDAATLTTRFPRLKALPGPDHPGVGLALRAAFAEVRHPLVFYVSCAEKYRPAELAKFLRHIDTVHLIGGYRAGRPIPAGWRMIGAFWLGWNRWVFGIQKPPLPGWLGWRRHLGAFLAKLFFGVAYRDPGCPCRLLRREILARMPIQSTGAFAHVEILAKANFLGCLLGEEIPLGDPQRPVAADEPTPPVGELLREGRRVFQHPDFGPPPLPPAPPAPPPGPPVDPSLVPEPPAATP